MKNALIANSRGEDAMALATRRWAVVCLLIALITTSRGQAWGEERTSKQRALFETFLSEFVSVRPGEEGFPDSLKVESLAQDDSKDPQTIVIPFTNPFQISKYEVYQDLYEAVMGENPSRWKGPRNSAERISHEDAVEFCTRLTSILREENLIGETQVVRLPTETEWLYCAKGGTNTAYSFGDNPRLDGDQGTQASRLDDYAWHTGNAAGNDPAVGVLKPNLFGLYDIHGYLWEYCLDDWTPDFPGGRTTQDGLFRSSTSTEVTIRGGSWKDPYSLLRLKTRKPFPKAGGDDAVGFRCVLVEARAR
ncbi:formylglycine-generating enzyme family protein [Thalassoglobus sp. JC818]|uniref:formylglycine-generating enzyme family protein n=1 Tax=Thalassoglobus sp. JC818 TaxID=3232136 RepID=UPI00345B3EE2